MQCTVEALEEYQCKPRRHCSRGPGRSEAEPTVRGPFRVVVAGAGACASTRAGSTYFRALGQKDSMGPLLD